MGKLLSTVMSIMTAFIVVGIFMGAMYVGSNDPTKETFSTHAWKVNNSKEILENGTSSSYSITTDTTNNFEQIANRIQESIADAQKGLNGSLLDQINAAFGLLSSLTMNVLYLFLAIIAETLNFFTGIFTNLMDLPPPWNYLGTVAFALGIPLLTVYVVIKLVATYTKTDI